MTFHKIIVVMMLISFSFLAGCENTMHGFGKDMEKAGENIQKSANDQGSSNTK